MEISTFSSPQAAEEAFYRAFAQGDHGAMMRIWARGDDTECIHPAGPRLCGYDSIARSWEAIFSAPGRYLITLESCKRFHDRDLAVHIAEERITLSTDNSKQARVIATNVYRREPDGWKIILHHASPASADHDAGRTEAARHIH